MQRAKAGGDASPDPRGIERPHLIAPLLGAGASHVAPRPLPAAADRADRADRRPGELGRALSGISRPLILSCALAVGIAWISANLHDRYGQEHDQAEVQIGILTGDVVQYLPQWSGRVLFPLAQVLLQALAGVSSVTAFVVLRHLTLAGMLLTVWLVARRLSHSPFANREADRVTFAVAALLLLSFNHAWQTPTDCLDVLTFALGTSYAVQGRYQPMLILALLASANRESSVFLSLLWAGTQFGQVPTRTLIRQSAVLGVLAAAMVIVLRVGTVGWQAFAPPDMAGVAGNPLNVPSPMTIPLGLAMAGLCWSMGRPSRGIALACLAMVLLSAAGGTAFELRIYLPAVTAWTLASLRRS